MELKKSFYLIQLGILLLALAGLGACSGSGGNTTSSGGAGGPGTGGAGGTLTVSLTDSPFSEAKTVLVTFSEVQVHHSTNGWNTVPFTTGLISEWRLNSSRQYILERWTSTVVMPEAAIASLMATLVWV